MPSPPASPVAAPPVDFRASWSRSTKLLTALFLFCAAAILVFSYGGSPQFFYGTAGLLAAGVLFAFRYAPVGYRVDAGGVTILRRAADKPLPLATLRSARLLEPAELGQVTWRWPALGGLFGFYGWFETPALGRHQWYAARDERLVLLQVTQGPVVLSPDEPESFVREVNQRVRAAARIP
ncbi:MAG: PH domain-containing protein [Bryobacteraceae bacterium]|nr:PH domain-containing protein [Bryobacteraceae bacterium]